MQSGRACEPPASVAIPSPTGPRTRHAATADTAIFSRRPQRSGSESRRERSIMIIALLLASGLGLGGRAALLALRQRGLAALPRRRLGARRCDFVVGTLTGGLAGPGRLEVQRGRVDAVALTSRTGPVVEDVAEVPSAVAADDLGAVHEVAVVGPQLDRLGDGRLGEARPAGARVELGVGVEQLRAAGR